MAHHNPKILEMVLIGTEDDPLLKMTFVEDVELIFDTRGLHRFISDSLDWSLLMDDLEADRRGA
jgi:hypothetical protein